MLSLLSRAGVRRVLVLPLFLVGLGACRLLLGIDDPGPALGPEADATPNDGALPPDGPTAPDVLTDAGVDSDGLDGGGPCRLLVDESFAGAASYTSTSDVDGGGVTLAAAGGMQITVGSGTGQATRAFVEFTALPAGAWKTAILKVDLTLNAIGTSDASVTDRIIQLQSSNGKSSVGLARTTDMLSRTYRVFDDQQGPVATIIDIPLGKPVKLTYTVASELGDPKVGMITLSSPAVTNPHSSVLKTDDGKISLSIGSLGIATPPPPLLSYIIHKVTLCVQ